MALERPNVTRHEVWSHWSDVLPEEPARLARGQASPRALLKALPEVQLIPSVKKMIF